MRYSPSSYRRLLASLVIAAAPLPAISCGDGSDGSGEGADRPEAQPVPDASTFQEGNFDRLPRYPGAQAASEPAVEDDTTSQTFTVESATPERVIDYYARELAEEGWQVVSDPRQLGAEETHRGTWRKDDQMLVVSTTRFSGFEEAGESRTTQFSLSLGPG